MTTTAPHTVRCNILGTLEIWADRHRIRLGGPIQERVLVTLLLEPGRVVPVTRLVQTVWDDDPPATAVHQIRKAVADLRRRIPEGASLVVTDGPGYRAVVDDDQLDLSRFHRLTAQARRDVAAGLTDQAADRLCEALALWRGSVMAGRGGAALTAAATALDERRLTATEQLYQLRLDRGEAGELIGDLRALVAEHPLCENLRGQLMLALYRSGRAAEALEEYGRARALLVEELGMDPGPRLTRLYEAILRDAEELAAPEQPAAPAPAPPTAPQPPAPLSPSTLPYDLTDFTGRERELGQLLAGAQRPSEGTRIVALDGMGGSGKTSLAVRASHQLAEAYPDGRLFINLRGYSPVEKPVQPSAALGALLRTLGVPDQRVPEDESGRTALWRATLAERRVLLLLDNALDAAQVLPLLPASPGCLVIVTSRARLVELDGAEWIHIGVMRPEDSTTLLAETLGDERAAAEPEAVAELAELCGQLPLALRIASARLCNRSRWTVQYLVDRLGDERRRLGELSAGDRSVAATIQLSYQMMEERHRTAFRLIGLHPGTDVDVQSVAALLGTDRWDAEDILERLLDVHLVQQQKMGRYGLHDLVRSFAQTLRTEGTAEADRAAVERVVDYYVAASEQACTVLFPGRARHAPGLPPTTAELPAPKDAAEARAWFAREHRALLSAVGLCHERGLDRQTGFLARNVLFHLHLRSYFEEYETVARYAVESARRLGEPWALRAGLSNLVSSHWKTGRFRDGLAAAEEALGLARSCGDRHGEAVSLDQLGLLHSSLGHLAEGRDHLIRSIALHENAMRKEMALCNLSTVYAWLGQYEKAAEVAEEAISLHRSDGDPAVHVMALNDLAVAHLGLGAPEAAARCVERALDRGDESALPEEIALSLALAADAGQRLGRATPAYEERALALVRTRGTTLRRCQIENIVGRLHRHRGAYAQALALHEHAAHWAEAIEYRVELARAFDGMARTMKALGDAAGAARHRERADLLFDEMGMPEPAR